MSLNNSWLPVVPTLHQGQLQMTFRNLRQHLIVCDAQAGVLLIVPALVSILNII